MSHYCCSCHHVALSCTITPLDCIGWFCKARKPRLQSPHPQLANTSSTLSLHLQDKELEYAEMLVIRLTTKLAEKESVLAYAQTSLHSDDSNLREQVNDEMIDLLIDDVMNAEDELQRAEADAASVLNEWAKEQVITEKQEVTAVVKGTHVPLHYPELHTLTERCECATGDYD